MSERQGITHVDLMKTCAEDIRDVIQLYFDECKKPRDQRDSRFNATGTFHIIEERVHLLKRFIEDQS